MHQCICYETETSLSITFVLRWSCAVDRTLKEKFDSQNDTWDTFVCFIRSCSSRCSFSRDRADDIVFLLPESDFLCNPKDYTDTRAQNTENK